MALIQQLKQKRGFTSTEAEIADYILSHKEDVAAMKIDELAKATYTSKAAVVRMCAKLGLDGYRSFRLAFAVELERQRVERLDIDIDRPFTRQDGAASVMHSISLIEKRALDACYASISPGAIDRVARTLLRAKRIYCDAVGDTYITVTAFANMLMKLGIHCLMMDCYGERRSMARGVQRGDVMLLVTYSGGMLAHLRQQIDTVKANGGTVILVSMLDDCPGVDLYVTLPDLESATGTSGKAGGFFSQTAIRYVLDSIYGTIYTIDLERNQQLKDRLELTSPVDPSWQV